MNAVAAEHGTTIGLPLPLLNDFSMRAKKIIGQYIKSAILIDDDWPAYDDIENMLASGAYLEVEKEAAEEDENADENSPPLGSFEAAFVKTPAVPAFKRSEEASRLLKIQDYFLKEGVICTGFKYKAGEHEQAPKLAKNADIVILDWNFAGDGGAGAVDILNALKDGHLRFVCIFTDQTDLSAIKKRILEDVCKQKFVDGEGTDFKAENFIFTLRNKIVGDENSVNGSSEKLLLDDAISHLSTHYCGFLQLAMLELTSRHRASLLTHLARFSPEYDAALLSESGFPNSPFDAESNLRALLVDEWKVALEASIDKVEMEILGKAGRIAYAAGLKQKTSKISPAYLSACLDALSLSVKELEITKYFAVPEGETLRKFDSLVGVWLDGGAVGTAPGPRNYNDKDKQKMTIALLYAINNEENSAEAPTAEKIYKHVFGLDALFSQQQLLPVELTQGTILKYDKNDYLICITPLCDTARLKQGFYPYTFLSATRTADLLEKKAEYCVFMEKEEPICLHVDIKRPFVYEVGHECRTIKLQSTVKMYPLQFPPKAAKKEQAKETGPTLAQPETVRQAMTEENNFPKAVASSPSGSPAAADVKQTDGSSAHQVENHAAIAPASAVEQDVMTTAAATANISTEIADVEKLDNVSEISCLIPTESKVAVVPAFEVVVVGQLRTDFFLMLTAAAASNASRVGVNRVEFIRNHKV